MEMQEDGGPAGEGGCFLVVPGSERVDFPTTRSGLETARRCGERIAEAFRNEVKAGSVCMIRDRRRLRRRSEVRRRTSESLVLGLLGPQIKLGAFCGRGQCRCTLGGAVCRSCIEAAAEGVRARSLSIAEGSAVSLEE